MVSHRMLLSTPGRFLAVMAMATALALVVSERSIAQGSAATSRDAKHGNVVHERPAGQPVLAIVSLSDQHVTIYDAAGKAMQSPVSTGAAGYETPAGIFTIVQKKEMHQSNLYEDGQMPFMQRITWTGIALHAGVLPGHPASHGCIRLPTAFAERLFDLTELGLRVIIVRDDIAPMPIAHPGLLIANPAMSSAGPVTNGRQGFAPVCLARAA